MGACQPAGHTDVLSLSRPSVLREPWLPHPFQNCVHLLGCIRFAKAVPKAPWVLPPALCWRHLVLSIPWLAMDSRSHAPHSCPKGASTFVYLNFFPLQPLFSGVEAVGPPSPPGLQTLGGAKRGRGHFCGTPSALSVRELCVSLGPARDREPRPHLV